MQLPTHIAVLLSSLVVFGSVVLAQQAEPPAQPASRRITLDVVVAPKTGAPVPGLQKQDFTVLDNGVPQPIATFAAVGGQPAPLEVVLLIDAVNTNFQNIAFERKQIDNFLQSDGGRLAHPTALAIFSDTGTHVQDGFSTDGNALATVLDQQTIGLRDIRPDSQWAAQERLQISLEALNQLATKEAARPGRKVIFWVSPGWPLLSGPMVNLDAKQIQQLYSQIADTSTLLRKGNITLYGIDPLGPEENAERSNFFQSFLKPVTKPSQAELGDLGLQVLAVQTGGLALGPSNDIAHLLERCMADTAAYYELSFDAPPAEHRNEYHSIQIKVSQPGLTARTRTGYYAQP
jgi:VWFA-related protein